MTCPYCGCSESAVVRSRALIASDKVRRRRQCAECGEQFPTAEGVDYDQLRQELQATGKALRPTVLAEPDPLRRAPR